MNKEYTAIIKQEGDWWIGWIEEVSGSLLPVICLALFVRRGDPSARNCLLYLDNIRHSFRKI